MVLGTRRKIIHWKQQLRRLASSSGEAAQAVAFLGWDPTEWYRASGSDRRNHSRHREWKWEGQRDQGAQVTRAKDEDVRKGHLNVTVCNCHFQVTLGYRVQTELSGSSCFDLMPIASLGCLRSGFSATWFYIMNLYLQNERCILNYSAIPVAYKMILKPLPALKDPSGTSCVP